MASPGDPWRGLLSFSTTNAKDNSMSDTDTDTIDATIIMWRDRGVNPGGIANALRAEGLGQWTTSAVRSALKRLDEKASIIRDPGRRLREDLGSTSSSSFTSQWTSTHRSGSTS